MSLGGHYTLKVKGAFRQTSWQPDRGRAACRHGQPSGPLRPLSAEFEPAPKNSRAPVIEQVESPLKIPETPEVALEKMQREEDNHSEDGNTPSYLCGR